MKIELHPALTDAAKNQIVEQIEQLGGSVRYRQNGLIGATAASAAIRDRLQASIAALPGVASATSLTTPYKFVSREFRAEPSVVEVAGVRIGGPDLVVVAGPCSVESEQQILRTAESIAASGAVLLRGGAFKPRTSPYEFRGLGEEGLELLDRARRATGLGIVTEVMAPEDVPLVAAYADLLQIGARNMQNFPLLTAAGRSGRPVLLKRGLSATVNEFLMAAEYVLSEGNPHVILCERGIRGFDAAHTRNVFDVAAIPVLQQLTHLPVVADPSHAAGRRDLVPALSRSAVAAGADALLIEVHPNPAQAWSDGPQSLTLEGFGSLMKALAPYRELRRQDRAEAMELAVVSP